MAPDLLLDRGQPHKGWPNPRSAGGEKPAVMNDCVDILMRTLSCTITFKDGSKLLAKASSRMAGAEVPVEYSGATEKLGTLIESASLGFLEWYLRSRAQNMGESFEVESGGDYESSV